MTPRELRVRRALVGLGLTMGITAPAMAADPGSPATSRVATIYHKSRSFRIPFNISHADRARRRELQLWISDDQGRHWAKKGVATPDRPSFTFQAPRDGEFWLAVRSVDNQGKLYPSDEAKIEPSMKVVVDTTPPALILKPESRSASLASLRWEINDDNPDCESLILAYQVEGKEGWRPVPAQNAERSGVITWDAGASGAIKVRALVVDRAGNETRANTTVDASRPADVVLTSNVPTSQPRSQSQMPITRLPSEPPPLKDEPAAPPVESPVAKRSDIPPEVKPAQARRGPPAAKPAKPDESPVAAADAPKLNESPEAAATMPPPLADGAAAKAPVAAIPAAENPTTVRDDVVTPPPHDPAEVVEHPPAPAAKAEAEPPAADEGRPEVVTPVQAAAPPPALDPQMPNAGAVAEPATEPEPPKAEAATTDPGPGLQPPKAESAATTERSEAPKEPLLAPPMPPTQEKAAGDTPPAHDSGLATGPAPAPVQDSQDPKDAAAPASKPNANRPATADSKTIADEASSSDKILTIRLPNPDLSLPYEVDDAGPNGPGAVELWVTRDAGRTWRLLANDPDRKSPFQANLGGPGKFGLTLVARDDQGQVAHTPVPGDPPQMWVEVQGSAKETTGAGGRSPVAAEAPKAPSDPQAKPARLGRSPSLLQRFFGRSRPGAQADEADPKGTP